MFYNDFFAFVDSFETYETFLVRFVNIEYGAFNLINILINPYAMAVHKKVIQQKKNEHSNTLKPDGDSNTLKLSLSEVVILFYMVRSSFIFSLLVTCLPGGANFFARVQLCQWQDMNRLSQFF